MADEEATPEPENEITAAAQRAKEAAEAAKETADPPQKTRWSNAATIGVAAGIGSAAVAAAWLYASRGRKKD